MTTEYHPTLIKEAQKYATVDDFLTAQVSQEVQDLFYQLFSNLSLTEAKAKAIELYKKANSNN